MKRKERRTLHLNHHFECYSNREEYWLYCSHPQAAEDELPRKCISAITSSESLRKDKVERTSSCSANSRDFNASKWFFFRSRVCLACARFLSRLRSTAFRKTIWSSIMYSMPQSALPLFKFVVFGILITIFFLIASFKLLVRILHSKLRKNKYFLLFSLRAQWDGGTVNVVKATNRDYRVTLQALPSTSIPISRVHNPEKLRWRSITSLPGPQPAD